MKCTDYAYLAGLFDGEGYIFINVNRGRYILYLGLGMTCKYIPQWLQFAFGGHLQERRRIAEDGRVYKTIWYWNAAARIAYKFLKAIYPYLIGTILR